MDRKLDASGRSLLRSVPPRDNGDRTSSRPPGGIRRLARGTIFVAFRQAVIDLYGDVGLRSLAEKLPIDVCRDTVDSLLIVNEWLPEEHVIAWYEVLWSHTCSNNRSEFKAVIDRMLDLGFGRVRKALLKLADPSAIILKGESLWRHDHTHGYLSIDSDERSARVRLDDHPYTQDPLSCLATAEIYRYCVALCRARDVTENHYNEPSGALIVRVRWER